MQLTKGCNALGSSLGSGMWEGEGQEIQKMATEALVVGVRQIIFKQVEKSRECYTALVFMHSQSACGT